MKRRAWLLGGVVAVAIATPGMSCAPATTPHLLLLDPAEIGEPLPRALLGHYDLSGALLAYDQVPGLVAGMADAGFQGADWRIGLGRWEAATRLLPTSSDGTPCPIPTAASAAPAGATDLDLIASRDWFTDDGAAVTLADTTDEARYALGYARSAIDMATTFGAIPFLSVDAMPRALAVNRSPFRDDCLWTFKNQVSNVRPASDAVFGAALAGAVDRLVAGSGGEPGRPVTHVEIWNEPDLPFFWDPAFEDLAGPIDRFFNMAITSLVALDDLRATSSHAAVQNLRIGLAGFAGAGLPETVLGAFDAAILPGGRQIPMDFISFHAYSDDPLDVVDRIDAVAAAAAATQQYAGVELVLSEWGPNLDSSAGDPGYAASMAPALHVATVLSLGAAAGLDRAHHAILWDFYPGIIQLGILDGAVTPKPAHRAYAMLADIVTGDSVRLTPSGAADGRVSADVSALASRDAGGTVRMLLVNRGKGTALIETHLGDGVGPRSLMLFRDPAAGPSVSTTAGTRLLLPPESLVLATY